MFMFFTGMLGNYLLFSSKVKLKELSKITTVKKKVECHCFSVPRRNIIVVTHSRESLMPFNE